MNATTAKIDEVLVDVRKAYRLLHDYQRMALDAMNYLGKQFGMTYGGGWPKFSDGTAKVGRGRLDNSAWDWLGMMFCEFHFYREFGNKWVGMSVLLISDTGYFCANDESLDRINVSGFQPSEQSSTKVGFLLTANEWPDMTFLGQKTAIKTFIEAGGKLPDEIAATGMIGKCCDFSRLASEDATNVLIGELIAQAKRAGIKLERVAAKV